MISYSDYALQYLKRIILNQKVPKYKVSLDNFKLFEKNNYFSSTYASYSLVINNRILNFFREKRFIPSYKSANRNARLLIQ